MTARHGAPWTVASTCGGCGKLNYASRRAAKKALRALYPGDVGHSMNAYPCPNGGSWHIGHRSKAPKRGVWPVWFDTDLDIMCGRCPARIPAGDPAAWLPGVGVNVCLDCGDAVERAVLAAAS